MSKLQVAGVRFHLERVLNAAEVEAIERALLEQGIAGHGQPFSPALAELDDAALPYLAHVRRVIAQLTWADESHQEPWRAQRVDADQLHTQPQGLGLLERRRGGERTHCAVLYLGSCASGDATDFPGLQLRLAPAPGTLVVWTLLGSFRMAQMARPRAVRGESGERWELVTWVREVPCNADPSDVPTREIRRLK